MVATHALSISQKAQTIQSRYYSSVALTTLHALSCMMWFGSVMLIQLTQNVSLVSCTREGYQSKRPLCQNCLKTKRPKKS